MYWFPSACSHGSLAVLPRPRTSALTTTAEPFRPDLVERVRRDIAAGTYDTDEKWEAALDHLFDHLLME
jgi:hypothetical protein